MSQDYAAYVAARNAANSAANEPAASPGVPNTTQPFTANVLDFEIVLDQLLMRCRILYIHISMSQGLVFQRQVQSYSHYPFHKSEAFQFQIQRQLPQHFQHLLHRPITTRSTTTHTAHHTHIPPIQVIQ
jgi:hypothetical protein